MENYYSDLRRIHNCLESANLPGICEFITTAFTPENEQKQVELNRRNAPYAADCLQMIGEQGLKMKWRKFLKDSRTNLPRWFRPRSC